MSAKKAAAFVGVALVLFFVISNPNGAAGAVRDGIGLLEDAAQSLIDFAAGLL